MRDRLLLARDLLAPSGSIFVQISDENACTVRAVASEVFGSDNFVVTNLLKKKGGQHGQVAVKVIDDRGNELLVVEKLG